MKHIKSTVRLILIVLFSAMVSMCSDVDTLKSGTSTDATEDGKDDEDKEADVSMDSDTDADSDYEADADDEEDSDAESDSDDEVEDDNDEGDLSDETESDDEEPGSDSEDVSDSEAGSSDETGEDTGGSADTDDADECPYSCIGAARCNGTVEDQYTCPTARQVCCNTEDVDDTGEETPNDTGTGEESTEDDGTDANDQTGDDASQGCGSTSHPESGRATIDVSGTQREYILDIPSDYDPNTPYKLIFTPHPWGGSAEQIAEQGVFNGAHYGLESLSNGTSIFVAPDGIDQAWANTNGQDLDFFAAMVDFFSSNLCIDRSRIFSTGFSYGGMMSNALGCDMADVFRAIAPISGANYSGCQGTTPEPIAVWMTHGTNDGVVPLSDGQKALNHFIDKNGCSNETVPVEPSPCVAYQGCTDGAPVHYCEFDGDHMPPDFSPEGIWNFFNQF